MLRFYLAIFAGKITKKLSPFFKLGFGDTWSGEIALFICPKIIEKISPKIKNIVLVTGTNGKTTTVKMIKTLLGSGSFSNESGANLINGIVGVLTEHYSEIKKGLKKTAVLEVDEATFPHLLKKLKPKAIVILNLFRDQLDRFGEVNTVAKNWREALSKLDSTTSVVLNADDPQVAFLGHQLEARVLYFGLKGDESFNKRNDQVEMWGDSFLCPRCSSKLTFTKVFFSHLGLWHCLNCQLERPKTQTDDLEIKIRLIGSHNKYNALAALLAVSSLNKFNTASFKALSEMKPAFGRWEDFYPTKFSHKPITLILSKNPTGMTQNLRIISQKDDLGCLLVVLNDNIPDGRDVSWIWDVNFPEFSQTTNFLVSGKRSLDMALRLKYEGFDSPLIEQGEDLNKTILKALSKIQEGKRLYILATYSAMLETRKILTGRKIL